MHIETVLANREQTHGIYREQAKLSQTLKLLLRETRNWNHLDFYQAQSLEEFCTKISRILNGNFNEVDHWRDISGYASLVIRELEGQTGGAKEPEVPFAKLPVSIRPQENDEVLNAPEFLLKKMEDDMEQLLKK